MRPADIAITLRRRTPWEACDLGLTMLQRWWREAYASHALVAGTLAAAAFALAWSYDVVWAAFIAVWWLKPLYDRVVLHILSRAVFGERQGPRALLAHWREWMGTGLLWALTFGRFDLARSFNLPIRQLEGQSGRAGRARMGVLGRKARSYAVWLTAVCVHFELVLYWSLQSLVDLVLPAKAQEGVWVWEMIFRGSAEGEAWGTGDVLAYAAAVLLFEPFYVAAGFGLYLNRRTLLEGWDIEVALRRIAEKHAAAALVVLFLAFSVFGVSPVSAQQKKDPKSEIAEVLKAREFGHYRDTTVWREKNPSKPKEQDFRFPALGYGFAKAMEALGWILVAALAAWALWRLWKSLPAASRAPREAYRPPAALFGMELAPETLPADVAAAAAALAAEGKLREALSLLYRGALSTLVHQRGVELLASHTEREAVNAARSHVDPATTQFFQELVLSWQKCAYAKQLPGQPEMGTLVAGYRSAFQAAAA